MRDLPFLSNAFQRLYCDPAPFVSFSTFHPISFARVLPYQRSDPVLDDYRLIYAEEAHLAGRSDETRRRLVEAYLRCGLLERGDAFNLATVIDFFDADFFELMGLIYANAGMFRCALRWQREFIRELETKIPDTRSDLESVCYGYPFKAELDAGTLPRHKMNLIFATCGRADALIEMGYLREAKRLLCEAALVEPEVRFIRERIAALP